jgi:hypothetical protein
MKTRQGVTGEFNKRYKAAKAQKEKTKILDEFVSLIGCNRKYGFVVLNDRDKTRMITLDGKTVTLKAKPPRERKRRTPGFKYGEEVTAVLALIWEFFDYQRGQLLAPFIRGAIDFLAAESAFGITEEIKAKLLAIRSSTINRRLKPERKKLEIHGKSLSKPGILLKNQIPARVFFAWDERKPGFFEMDTVSHCGANGSGEFCSTLTLTDVCSGWTVVTALRNRAHIRVKAAVEQIHKTLPFPLLGLDSDNGGEFINTQVKQWCDDNGIQFTRSRPYRKNDNCFVEQKNGDVVRKSAGCYRCDSDDETAALAEVYRRLKPLVNFWYPAIKITGKNRPQNGRLKKSYDTPKTPYQRLLESPDISENSKARLRLTASAINPVEIKREQNKALAKLLNLNNQKYKAPYQQPPVEDADGQIS